MTGPSFILLATLGLAVRGNIVQSDEPKNRKESNNINGSWRMLSVKGSGIVLRPEKGEEIIYAFKDGKLSVKRSEGNNVQTSDNGYELDASKEPPTIEMTMTFFITTTVNGKTKSSKQEKKMHGIYRVQGDKLQLCITYLDHERPTKFLPPEKGTGFLITCERLK